MNIGEALRAAWREIAANKTRSALSFAAVAVGTASVVYTFAQTRGMSKAYDEAARLMGPGRMTVAAKRDYVSKGLSPGLTAEDAAEIRRAVPGLFMVYAKARHWGADLVDRGTRVENVPLQAVGPEWRLRDWVYTLKGRFLREEDERDAARVCVLVTPGGWIKKPFWAAWWPESPHEALFKRRDFLGRRILLQGRVFTVVGVLQEPPKDTDPRWFHWEDVAALVPLAAYHRTLKSDGATTSPTAVDEIQIDAGDEASIGPAKRAIEAALKRRHRGEEDFEVQDMKQVLEDQLRNTRRYVLIGTALGAVALLAGGIGIMNVTLATVFSRVKEIGVRRALGATRADVLAQFVAEAMLLGLAGGAAGIVLGVAGVSYLSHASERMFIEFAWHHAVGALGISLAVCALFALGPAWHAAKMDPVAALREEA